MSDQKVLLTTAEAAARLHVSPSWLKRRAAAGTVPHVRLGRSVRFSEADISAIIESGRITLTPATL